MDSNVMIPIGADVEVPVKPIRGKVLGYALSTDGKTLTHVVEYEDVVGNTQQRHFSSSELQLTNSGE